MKVDVYKRKQTFLNWKERVQKEGIPGLSKANESIVIQYVLDMELGRNVGNGAAKGGRSYTRLCNLAQRMTWIARMLESRGVSDLRDCKEQVVVTLFSEMERGIIRREDGKAYRSHGDYVRVFKAFWHWWMKVNRKEGKSILDITEDISAPRTKPLFVNISKGHLDKMLPYFSDDEQVILYFVFDSLIRAPTEILSLQVQHIYEQDGEVWLTIPDEVSKTFGRTMNLLYCGQAVLDYIHRRGLSPTDHLFSFDPRLLNKKLQAVAVQLFGNVRSHAQGEFFSSLTLYDFRHSGAVHLRIFAKENPGLISLDAIRHRGGWTDFSMVNYYTQFLGIDGKIEKQGMLLQQDKHKLEREVDTLKQELAALKEMNAKILQMAQKGLVTMQPLFG